MDVDHDDLRSSDSWDFDSEVEPHYIKSKMTVNSDIILEVFTVSRRQRSRLASVMKNYIRDLVKKRNNEGSPTHWCYVPTLPAAGKAHGKCLALDFGCSNHFIQVSLCDVRKDSDAVYRPVDSRAFLLTPTVRHAEMDLFADFVAVCLKQILLENKVKYSDAEEPIFLGISAGFDVKVRPQRYPASASVVACSKDFQMPGFLGRDIVPPFHAAFKRAGMNIRIVTVINDTIDTLLTGIYQISNGGNLDYDCSIGVLCHRSGSNIAYLETDPEFLDMCSVDQRQLLSLPNGRGFCATVNTECGYSIGASGELADLANAIDDYILETLNVPFRLEYVTSGAWYPQILHRAIQVLCTTNVMKAKIDKHWKLNQSNCFKLFVYCDQYDNKPDSGTLLASHLKPILRVSHLSDADADLIAAICQSIVSRTATVVAVCVRSIAERIYGKSIPRRMAVAYGGTLFNSLSQLSVQLEHSLKSMVPRDTEVLLVQSEALMGCAITALDAGAKA